ncbi:hypothetical protein [Paenibacillus planticolens]|nr:hypothetical protein [Paenibacillus planticolens]
MNGGLRAAAAGQSEITLIRHGYGIPVMVVFLTLFSTLTFWECSDFTR